MKKIFPLLTILAVCFFQPAFAQKKTSLLETISNKIEDQLHPPKKKETKTPNLSNNRKTSINTIHNSKKNYPLIEIPVVFHVVHKNYPSQNLTKPLFDALLTSMNQGFNTVDYGVIDKDYLSIVGIPKIRFQYASILLNCATINDITYHETAEENFGFYHSQKNEQEGKYDPLLKRNGYVDSKKVLNIWICDLEGVGSTGYSSYPKEVNALNDGIVLDIGVLKSHNKEFKRIAICHELGHYFGLYHIWGKGFEILGCTPNGGDKIEDTPPQKKRNTYKRVLNADIERVCFNPVKLSNYQNYMDYSFLGGMFTQGQVDRMREQIKLYRPELINKVKCPQGTTIGNSTSNTIINQNNNGEVCFSNPNMYSRKIILTNTKTGAHTSLVVGLAYYPKSTTRCTYNLETGIYNCKIYTTFTNTLTEEFQLKITSSSQEIKITKDGYN